MKYEREIERWVWERRPLLQWFNSLVKFPGQWHSELLKQSGSDSLSSYFFFFSAAGLQKVNSTEWNSLANTQPLHTQYPTKNWTSDESHLENSKRKVFAINRQMFFTFGELENTWYHGAEVYEVTVSPLICCFITFIYDRTEKQRCTTNDLS